MEVLFAGRGSRFSAAVHLLALLLECRADQSASQSSGDHLVHDYGDKDFYLKLRALTAVEGNFEPPFNPDVTQYSVTVEDETKSSLGFTVGLDWTRYNAKQFQHPNVYVDGQRLQFAPPEDSMFNITLDDNIGPVDRLVHIKVTDPTTAPSGNLKDIVGMHSENSLSYTIHVFQPPDSGGIVRATSLTVVTASGAVIEPQTKFDMNSTVDMYSYVVGAHDASVSVDLECPIFPGCTRVLEGSVMPIDAKMKVELGETLQSKVEVSCQYRHERWAKDLISRTYALQFRRQLETGVPDVYLKAELFVMPDQGYCESVQRSDPYLQGWTNSEPDHAAQSGFVCRVQQQSVDFVVAMQHKGAMSLLENQNTKKELSLQNAIPRAILTQPGREFYSLRVLAGTLARLYPVLVMRVAACNTLQPPVHKVLKPTFRQSSAKDSMCLEETCSQRDVDNCFVEPARCSTYKATGLRCPPGHSVRPELEDAECKAAVCSVTEDQATCCRSDPTTATTTTTTTTESKSTRGSAESLPQSAAVALRCGGAEYEVSFAVGEVPGLGGPAQNEPLIYTELGTVSADRTSGQEQFFVAPASERAAGAAAPGAGGWSGGTLRTSDLEQFSVELGKRVVLDGRAAVVSAVGAHGDGTYSVIFQDTGVQSEPLHLAETRGTPKFLVGDRVKAFGLHGTIAGVTPKASETSYKVKWDSNGEVSGDLPAERLAYVEGSNFKEGDQVVVNGTFGTITSVEEALGSYRVSLPGNTLRGPLKPWQLQTTEAIRNSSSPFVVGDEVTVFGSKLGVVRSVPDDHDMYFVTILSDGLATFALPRSAMSMHEHKLIVGQRVVAPQGEAMVTSAPHFFQQFQIRFRNGTVTKVPASDMDLDARGRANEPSVGDNVTVRGIPGLTVAGPFVDTAYQVVYTATGESDFVISGALQAVPEQVPKGKVGDAVLVSSRRAIIIFGPDHTGQYIVRFEDDGSIAGPFAYDALTQPRMLGLREEVAAAAQLEASMPRRGEHLMLWLAAALPSAGAAAHLLSRLCRRGPWRRSWTGHSDRWRQEDLGLLRERMAQQEHDSLE